MDTDGHVQDAKSKSTQTADVKQRNSTEDLVNVVRKEPQTKKNTRRFE